MGRTTALRALLLAVAATVLVGCSGGSEGAPGSTPTAAPTPSALGGPRPARHAVPSRVMSSLERPVAARLAARIADEGLTLSFLDCPRWDNKVPARMTCQGYVDGLVVPVRVRLHAEAGTSVGFDAHLGAGVVATRRLVGMIVSREGGRADCGDVPAYPARVGTAIVCRLVRSGQASYVVATVRSRSGAVTVEDYRGTPAGR